MVLEKQASTLKSWSDPKPVYLKEKKRGGGNLFLLTCKSVRVTVWMLKAATEN